jgi:hypothetical protein
MRNLFRRVILGLVAAFTVGGLLVAPSVVSPETSPQAQAAYESVDNHWRSTVSISVRIYDNGVTSDYNVAPNSGVAAGNDRLVSWYLRSYSCADVQSDGGFRTVRTYGTGQRFNIPLGDNLLIRTWRC